MCTEWKEAWCNEKCKEIAELERKKKPQRDACQGERDVNALNLEVIAYATKMGKCYSIQMTLLTDVLNMPLNYIMTREVTHQMSVTRTAVLL